MNNKHQFNKFRIYSTKKIGKDLYKISIYSSDFYIFLGDLTTYFYLKGTSAKEIDYVINTLKKNYQEKFLLEKVVEHFKNGQFNFLENGDLLKNKISFEDAVKNEMEISSLNITDIETKSYDEAEQKKMIMSNPENIKFIENPTELIKNYVLVKNGLFIRFIKEPSNAEKLLAVKQNGEALKYIKKYNEKIIENALTSEKTKGSSIVYIEKPTKEHKKLSLKQNLVNIFIMLENNIYVEDEFIIYCFENSKNKEFNFEVYEVLEERQPCSEKILKYIFDNYKLFNKKDFEKFLQKF